MWGVQPTKLAFMLVAGVGSVVPSLSVRLHKIGLGGRGARHLVCLRYTRDGDYGEQSVVGRVYWM